MKRLITEDDTLKLIKLKLFLIRDGDEINCGTDALHAMQKTDLHASDMVMPSDITSFTTVTAIT